MNCDNSKLAYQLVGAVSEVVYQSTYWSTLTVKPVHQAFLEILKFDLDYFYNILGSRSLVFWAGFAHVWLTLKVRVAHDSVLVAVLDPNVTIVVLVGQVEENMDGKEDIAIHIIRVGLFLLRITSRRTMKLLRFLLWLEQIVQRHLLAPKRPGAARAKLNQCYECHWLKGPPCYNVW